MLRALIWLSKKGVELNDHSPLKTLKLFETKNLVKNRGGIMWHTRKIYANG
jgi:hypothetical protein